MSSVHSVKAFETGVSALVAKDHGPGGRVREGPWHPGRETSTPERAPVPGCACGAAQVRDTWPRMTWGGAHLLVACRRRMSRRYHRVAARAVSQWSLLASRRRSRRCRATSSARAYAATPPARTSILLRAQRQPPRPLPAGRERRAGAPPRASWSWISGGRQTTARVLRDDGLRRPVHTFHLDRAGRRKLHQGLLPLRAQFHHAGRGRRDQQQLWHGPALLVRGRPRAGARTSPPISPSGGRNWP
jgi:hypothetical protein